MYHIAFKEQVNKCFLLFIEKFKDTCFIERSIAAGPITAAVSEEVCGVLIPAVYQTYVQTKQDTRSKRCRQLALKTVGNRPQF